MAVSALIIFSLETGLSFLDIVHVLETRAFIPWRSYPDGNNSITNRCQGSYARSNPWAAMRLLGPRREPHVSTSKGLLLHVAQERDMGIYLAMPHEGWNLKWRSQAE